MYNGSEKLSKSNLCLTEVNLDGIKGQGFTEFEYRNKDEKSFGEVGAKPVLKTIGGFF